jgi:hypothetical protein
MSLLTSESLVSLTLVFELSGIKSSSTDDHVMKGLFSEGIGSQRFIEAVWLSATVLAKDKAAIYMPLQKEYQSKAALNRKYMHRHSDSSALSTIITTDVLLLERGLLTYEIITLRSSEARGDYPQA